ncbi:ligase-associated DNA damage response endonuclease PdeM [Paracoccus sp. (in: a-proteobacteria)]|uniref:ligase-associated DNA damage response endonuclease PdeM n=1 Tax=Paracoccus sp. TaxID=267 RepID=UPI0026DECBD2|nr:ligase-associated DNA damage response endonuclease PdeM [Paracoccus sp. (in: a-proteobacteria)]MDO5648464.1 ligase-associated DNA damage response endonuclease PdeM [Paracoccus sp. (in: a-proteobacteria)]
MTQPTDYAFSFSEQDFIARPSGALWWPKERALIVSDLHLGKSDRWARGGSALLPPYENHATLDRLGAEIDALRPETVVSLGDSFDDDRATDDLTDDIRNRLEQMARGRSWLWVTGNHDPNPTNLPGQCAPEWRRALTFRHQAGDGPDVSGHYHPCIQLAGQRRRCFLVGQDHLILPSFGVYTGGLAVNDGPLRELVSQGVALTCGSSVIAVPVPQPRRPRRWR